METPDAPRNIGFGGARGGAKSHGARATMLLRRIKYPGTNGLILRRTFPELLSNHINPMFATWPQLRRHYNAQTKILTLPTSPQSLVEFRTADDAGRIARLQGSEFCDIDVEEATQFFEDDIAWLQTVNRYVGPHSCEPHMVLTCNPGGVGHTYIKRVFVDRDFRENEDPNDFAFIQSYAQDNVFWSMAQLKKDGLTVKDYYSWTDKERFDYFIKSPYGRVLNSLPAKLKGPHLYGDWTFFAGQYFDVFDPAIHVVCKAPCPHPEKHPEVEIQEWWPKWISMDWGWTDNSAIYWHTSDPKGNTYTYREMVINNTTADKIGGLIGEITTKAVETIENFYLSRDAFAQKQSERTIADELGDAVRPYGIPAPEFADQDRVGGWQLCYQLLQSKQLFVTRNCSQLLRLIPTLIRDAPENPNDVLAVIGDDPADSWRYGIKTRARIAHKPVEQEVRERLAAMKPADPTSAMIARRRIMSELEDEEAPVRMKPYSIQEELRDVR